MTTFVSLLRGINVGPNTTVKMEDLGMLYRSLGLENIRTYLRSGNVLFDAPDRESDTLATTIEDSLAGATGFPVKVLLRTGEELSRIALDNPFLREKSCNPGALHVTFLSGLPAAGPVGEMYRVRDETDRFIVRGTEIYLCCPQGYGRTKFSNAFFEKRLALVATTRNWKTVTALAEMVKE
ncbi:uncharacterized protein (DUF1697 family) [Methanolinea mesophila]|uniref:DUF1697 domain-containing protein n=1 Tax=Methanolinea mesophila TaxID=547055 RepID=UPI001AE6ED7A|nr:DUF1697 domain-containing protein [Methanolinea mesophila]MBP1929458.1 uncharacterized protein (DUF1697 family) [Methanolinea mesophila]